MLPVPRVRADLELDLERRDVLPAPCGGGKLSWARADAGVRKEIYHDYARAVDEAHEKMVWTHPGAENWYRNRRGRIVAITPWRNDMFWRMTRAADPADYRFG